MFLQSHFNRRLALTKTSAASNLAPRSRISSSHKEYRQYRVHSEATGEESSLERGEAESNQEQTVPEGTTLPEDKDSNTADVVADVEEEGEDTKTRRRPAGYTPFEYVTFGETELTHEVAIEVKTPLEEVFWFWQEQANYGEWFDIIGETILHKEDPRLTSYFCYYQWGHLPAVELYTTLCKMNIVENESMHDESVDGMPLATAVYFEETGSQSTKVTLRLAYVMPENLRQYVGPVGIWGDVNDILLEGMVTMKEQVEAGTAILMLEIQEDEAEQSEQNEDDAPKDKDMD